MADIPIEKSIELCEKYPSVVDRYFTRRHVQNEGGNDVCLLVHSNQICVVTLAANHAALQKGIAKVDFKVGNKLDRSTNKVAGKGKKGGQHVDVQSVLCLVECNDGSIYRVPAGIKAKLVEVNDRLVENPQLLATKTETEGYIAVLLLKPSTDGRKKTESDLKKNASDEAVAA